MLLNVAPFFKVIVLQIGIFESFIIDERHFNNEVNALLYADMMCERGYIATVVNVQ